MKKNPKQSPESTSTPAPKPSKEKHLDPLYDLFVVEGKLRLLELSLVFCGKELDDTAMSGVCTLLSEIQDDLGNVLDYCQTKEEVAV